MAFEIKTMISTYKPLYDVNDKYLPYGNYNFRIYKLTGSNSAIGELEINGIRQTYEFKYHSIIKMMARSQARLCRMSKLHGNDLPTYRSPKTFPDNLSVHSLTLTLPKIKHTSSPLVNKKKKICSICLDPILHEKQLDCKHSFHEKCITDWISSGKNTCPVCRDVIKLNENI